MRLPTGAVCACALEGRRVTNPGYGIRVDLDWGDVQPKNHSSFRWAAFDRVVHAARFRGLSVLPVIAYALPRARPAKYKTGTWSPAAPVRPAQFAAFAAAAVRRYARQGIHTWGIWNEPNNAGFWAPRANPRAYVKLLFLTVTAMRRRDPRVFIVSGGLAPEATARGNISQLQFFARMLDWRTHIGESSKAARMVG